MTSIINRADRPQSASINRADTQVCPYKNVIYDLFHVGANLRVRPCRVRPCFARPCRVRPYCENI